VIETFELIALPPIPWQTFNPNRSDVTFVGQCGDHLAHILLPTPGVREVYASEWNVDHYLGKHSSDFNMGIAEAMLPVVLLNPEMVCEGEKGELLFLGRHSRDHYLIVPVKPLPGELWLKTVFMMNVKKAEKKTRRGQWKILHKEVGQVLGRAGSPASNPPNKP
jgi:hypothetical protein